jgi:hypothetical protein
MQIVQIQRGNILARNASKIKIQRGELFIDKINSYPELLVGLGNGKYEKVGGVGGVTFAGIVPPETLSCLLSGESQPVKNGIYVLKGGNLDIESLENFAEPDSPITLFNGYTLTDKLFDGDILAYIKTGVLGDQESYKWIRLLSEKSLKVVLDTKADLDPTTGKVLLSQLPATITGGLDFQSAWDKQELPTLNAGNDNDTAIDPSLETHKNLEKGDYWIYAGSKWDITDVDEIIQKGEKEGDDRYYITSGDYLVYNGDNTWGVIDNTDVFIGIKIKSIINGESAVLDGVLVIFDTEREDNLMETVVTIKQNGIQFSSPNAALISNADKASIGTLYREKTGNKVLEPSGFSDDDTKAIIDEDNAQLNLKSSKYGKLTEIRIDDTAAPTTIQIIPKKSGYLINSNSIIDCGEWTTLPDGSIKFECEEGGYSEKYLPSNVDYREVGTLSTSTELSPEEYPSSDENEEIPVAQALHLYGKNANNYETDVLYDGSFPPEKIEFANDQIVEDIEQIQLEGTYYYETGTAAGIYKYLGPVGAGQGDTRVYAYPVISLYPEVDVSNERKIIQPRDTSIFKITSLWLANIHDNSIFDEDFVVAEHNPND